MPSIERYEKLEICVRHYIEGYSTEAAPVLLAGVVHVHAHPESIRRFVNDLAEKLYSILIDYFLYMR